MKSDNAKLGVARAPHRSLFKAMGYTDEELSRPLVGVCCAKNEIIPGHINLDKISQAVKDGQGQQERGKCVLKRVAFRHGAPGGKETCSERSEKGGIFGLRKSGDTAGRSEGLAALHGRIVQLCLFVRAFQLESGKISADITPEVDAELCRSISRNGN